MLPPSLQDKVYTVNIKSRSCCIVALGDRVGTLDGGRVFTGLASCRHLSPQNSY